MVGASAENLSALTLAARIADVDMNVLQRGMAMMARNLDLAQGAGNNAGRALKRLGISLAELRTKDAVEQLAILGKRFNEIKDDPTKTALAMQIFSRAGFNMIPVLNMLGREGLDGLIKKTKEMGLLMTMETSGALAAMADSFKMLNLTAKGAATQFSVGFARPVAAAMEQTTGLSVAVRERRIR